ncbi:hypothetical protein [Streptomyces regalis]|uniref:Uncharacterized protein n=1 Tax=Streptomyces regalis TaxID=68262 RepID=A0A101JHN2_9ACTN|nr:hypothetical protein [Streptomyces regalis]KUL26616.1 hypothetical protein ADL12_32170 [Streptomyces regalis]
MPATGFDAVSYTKTAADDRPVVTAVRKPGRTLLDGPVWLVKCPFCHRRHVHTADVVLTEMVLPARCNPRLFYRVQEVAR